MEKPTPQENDNGIPLTPTGIPSPYPYLNTESKEWEGADETDEFEETDEDEGLDSGGSAMARLHPDDPQGGSGDEIDPDEEDDNDDDDIDTGFGVGIGLFLAPLFAPPAPLMPA